MAQQSEAGARTEAIVSSISRNVQKLEIAFTGCQYLSCLYVSFSSFHHFFNSAILYHKA
jgi:hypothetical protein